MTVSGQQLQYTKAMRPVIAGKGLIQDYDGSGFIIEAYLNKTNRHFLREMFKKNLVDTKWLEMPSTLAIIIQFYVYNPNLQMMCEKRITIEFMETGGIINMEHDSVLINMRLYRTWQHSMQSYIICVLGLILTVTGIIDIKNEDEEKQQLEKEKNKALEEAAAEGEGEGEKKEEGQKTEQAKV